MLPSFYGYPGHDQVGVFFRDQAVAIETQGVRVDIAYVEPRSLREFGICGVRDNHFQVMTAEESGLLTVRRKGWNPCMNFSLGGLVWSKMTRQLVGRYIRDHGIPDLIHAHNIFWAGHAAISLAKHYNLPSIVTEHSSGFLLNQISSYSKGIAVEVLRNADEVLSVSSSLATSLSELSSARTIGVLPNVVDTDFFRIPEQERGDDEFVFLAVANLNANKGIAHLIKAFHLAFGGQINVQLRIGGDGPEMKSLSSLVRSLRIENQVHFLGHLSRKKVREEMWQAHALALSSFKETFGVVLLEAMATGLPVIATSSGGPQDIITPETGVLVTPGDLGAMSTGLKLMRSRVNSRYFSSISLRQYVVLKYEQNVVGAALCGIYDRILSERRKNLSR